MKDINDVNLYVQSEFLRDPREPERRLGRPTAVDLFAGVGGMSLGFEQAGFDVKAAVELDPVHAAVYAYNFSGTRVTCASVTELTGQAIRDASGLEKESIQCVFGSPPSQGFSVMGKRDVSDPRNAMIKEFARLVIELQAETFVLETAKGLLLGDHRALLDEVIETFSANGYNVSAPEVLNAGHFYVPQSRESVFLIGARKGQVRPNFPLPRCNIAGKKAKYPDLGVGPTCADALADLENADFFEALRHSDSVVRFLVRTPSDYAAPLTGHGQQDWHLGYKRDVNVALMTASARTEHTEDSRRRFAATAPGTVEPVSRFYRLAPNGVSPTLRAGTDASRGAFTSPRPIHFTYDRCITVREMARLHGFPDWFRFHVTKAHGARQVGQAVCPPLARAIAQEVVTALKYLPKDSNGHLEFRDPDLLSGNATQSMALLQKMPPTLPQKKR